MLSISYETGQGSNLKCSTGKWEGAELLLCLYFSPSCFSLPSETVPAKNKLGGEQVGEGLGTAVSPRFHFILPPLCLIGIWHDPLTQDCATVASCLSLDAGNLLALLFTSQHTPKAIIYKQD